jgi:hypothetical protein
LGDNTWSNCRAWRFSKKILCFSFILKKKSTGRDNTTFHDLYGNIRYSLEEGGNCHFCYVNVNTWEFGWIINTLIQCILRDLRR